MYSSDSLIHAVKHNDMGMLTSASRCDYGLDHYAKAPLEDIFQCYRNAVKHGLTSSELHKAMLNNKLTTLVERYIRKNLLWERVVSFGGIVNCYNYDNHEEDVKTEISLQNLHSILDELEYKSKQNKILCTS